MAILDRTREITADAALVWEVVADQTAAIAPGGARVEGVSGEKTTLTRRVIGPDNAAWGEACVAWTDGSLYTMQVDCAELPLAVNALRYTCSVTPDDASVRLRLYFDYQPAYGALGALVDRLGVRAQLAEWADSVLDEWVHRIHEREWAYRVTVSGLLDIKGRQVHSVAPGDTVQEAADALSRHRIGSVLVLESDGSIAGVLSERDIVRNLSVQGPALMQEPVSSIMTRDVIVTYPGDNMISVMSCMSQNRIRHLPVVEDSQVVGLVSIGDIVQARISELEGQSETLRDYIEARRWHELYREMGPAAYESGG